MDVKPPADVQESLLRSDGNEEEKIPLKSAKPVRSKGASFSLWLGPFFYRNPKRFTWLEWVFLAVSAATIIAGLVLNIRSVVVFAERDNFTLTENLFYSNFCNETTSTGFAFSCQSDLVLGIVVLVNIFFATYYVLDGLLREHHFELLAFTLAVLGIAIYVIINYIFQATRADSTTRLTDSWRLSRLVITVILSPASIILAAAVFHRMGSLQFDALGANPTLLRAYSWTRSLSALMKLHFEIFLTLFLMVATRVPLDSAPLAPHPAELAILCGLVIINLIGWVTSSVGMYLEWIPLTITSLVAMAIAALYYVFRIVWTSVSWSHTTNVVNIEIFDPTAIIAIVILLLCLGGLGLAVLSFPLSIKVMFNFRKGLKDKLLS